MSQPMSSLPFTCHSSFLGRSQPLCPRYGCCTSRKQLHIAAHSQPLHAYQAVPSLSCKVHVSNSLVTDLQQHPQNPAGYPSDQLPRTVLELSNLLSACLLKTFSPVCRC